MTPPDMSSPTFEQVRAVRMAHLQAVYRRIEAIMDDPDLTNAEYPPLVEACNEFNRAVSALLLLNGVFADFNQAADGLARAAKKTDESA